MTTGPKSSPPPSRTRSSIYPQPAVEHGGRAALAVAALGIVFGDLGTSPLYTLQECLSGPHGIAPTDAHVLGVLSLIFWSLTLVVTVKYLAFMMRADNDGEGGIMALLALTPKQRQNPAPGRIGFVALLVIIGAALLFGDGIITPAVSVLSAIEGLGVATAKLESAVVPLTVAILLGLFAVQYRGTAKLGRLFGPVMLLWFLTIAVLGVYHIAHTPAVLQALSPRHIVDYFRAHGLAGMSILGGVILCVTGGEALYADMGHFGRSPIRTSWLYICLPSLVLSYFGQGAVLLAEPAAAARAALAARPFYATCPQGVWLYPFVAIAALATIIASQALISGVFSLTYQAVQLGFFPRVTVRHTSSDAKGQIYLPLMNWGLAGACIALVLLFRESGKLAAAFGLAVSGTMAITSVVYFYVARHTWRWPLWKAAGVVALFLSFDVPFLLANTLKFFDGGYLPFSVGVLFVILMVNWRIGRGLLGLYLKQRAEPLDTFLSSLAERVLARPPGAAVFMASADGVPAALRRVVSRFHALPEIVILLTVVLESAPRVAAASRLQRPVCLEHGFYRVILHYGFMEEPDVHGDLALVLDHLELKVGSDELLYVLGRETFVASNKGKMGVLSESLFAFLSRNAKSPTDYFRLPPEQVIEVGAQIDL
ncbi:MAG TPA: KUP/HAK/KT family potassium transporter [Polyangiaceae bacterium]|nr:KUP/HAK/KT family potassium transporter [Polyangiaceae bacterium]